MGIRPGDGIAPLSGFLVLPNGRYAAKAWDDRAGLAVMLAAARRMRDEGIDAPGQVVWVATTQEEIGLRGAQTAVVAVDPDLGVSIEAGVAADYPGMRPTQAQERLGDRQHQHEGAERGHDAFVRGEQAAEGEIVAQLEEILEREAALPPSPHPLGVSRRPASCPRCASRRATSRWRRTARRRSRRASS